jgi:hypothetical protein
MKPTGISGTKRRNIWKIKIMSLQLRKRTRTSEIFVEE